MIVGVLFRRLGFGLLVLSYSIAPAAAQRLPAAPAPVASTESEDPPPPVPPEVISRGENGRMVVRATRVPAPLRIDGRLDEAVYATVPAITGFIQTLPAEGQVSTEKTEAWVMFDDNFFYVTGRMHEDVPAEKWTANEMRRDTAQLRQNDMFGFLIDTFHDRRNGYNFYANPLGGFADQVITDEGNPNVDWNPVWEVRTGRFPGGWTVEMAIPFKSIRYNSGSNQTWGLQLRRSIRRKNEWTHLTAVPAATGGSTSIFRVSRAATLIGLDLPPASRNIELKPYGITKVSSDVAKAVSNDVEPNAGLDAKVGITANLTADLSVNTDFAQVEVDEQQVNLTRFNLSFPEKRDFFLEGRGIFDFGRGGPSNSLASVGGASNSLTPALFYSRAIGLNAGRVIPLTAGGRITGKTGKYSIGLLNIETGNESVSRTPSTNFTVARLKRDILKRSSLGMMVTNRSNSTVVPGASNFAYGADAAFSFFQNVSVGGYYSASTTDGKNDDNQSYQGRFDYAADRYGLQLQFLDVGQNYNPEVGFVRRYGFDRTYASARFSPRPRTRFPGVRQFTYQASLEYIENAAGQLETRNQTGRFAMERQNSDLLIVEGGTNYELLVAPFAIAPGVRIPAGSYAFNDVTVSYQLGQQRRLNGTMSLQRGQFYDGTITGYGLTTARYAILKQWSVEPSLQVNVVELPAGDFTTTLLRARTDYGFSPRMFVSGLMQYSSTGSLFSSNFRFRWEFRPGSELFVVYTDERDTTRPGYPDLKNRGLVVKVNRLLRF
ncbi:MAG TPA: DUF5916 domain-containing protein [Vicinamibacterales bacterium]|nr:DUF5916 domain-containing protein [Vicinamibacterales bacterium]